MKPTLIAVDLAKNTFQIVVSTKPKKIDEEHRISRAKFATFFDNRAPATVLLETCGSAHFWARHIERRGHQVVLIPPPVIKPYRRTTKTDRNDARAMIEAARNAPFEPVPVKTIHQQTIMTLHRLRDQWKHTRTARINGVRGILREFGEFVPKGARGVVGHVLDTLADADSNLPDVIRDDLAEALDEIAHLERRMKQIDAKLRALAKQTPHVERLRAIPGIGLITSTAMVAFIGSAQRFPTGRHFAAYLGLVPKESSSGDRQRLGRITRRGNTDLRSLLIQGANSMLIAAKRSKNPDRLQRWALATEKRIHHNKAVCAIANRMARIAWKIWTTEATYRPEPKPTN